MLTLFAFYLGNIYEEIKGLINLLLCKVAVSKASTRRAHVYKHL